jgi:sialate O-acetylesterase
MKTYSAIFLLIIISIISCNSPKTEFSIAPIFSNKMVLQQAQSNAVWGTSAPFSKITLTSSWGEQVVTQTNDSGSWNLQLPTPAYNKNINTEGLSFTVSDGNSTIEINDILVGEVWLASGQSNMQWFMNQCDGCVINQDEEITNSANDMIRMFSVPQDLTGESIKFRKWLSANPENTGSFSATAYYFAKNLHDKLDMPIGIVNTSWGGTRVEAWMSPQKLNSLNETKNLIPNDYSFLDYQDFLKKQNDSISAFINEKYGYEIFNVPEWSEEKEIWKKLSKAWENLDLNDRSFISDEYDDSSWDSWRPSLNNYNGLKCDGRFEAVFNESDRLLSDGVYWFRTSINISDISKDYILQVEKGIDDSDQTYFNGKLIGNTYGWNLERKYTIPKNILKKGRNIIAIRVTDPGGGGGFNSPIKLYNENDHINVPFERFKYRHHGFISNGVTVIVHNYNNDELHKLDEEKRKDILKITPFNSPNGFSAMYECMLTPVMPYGVRGVIWYQGESNVGNFHEYTNLFSGMIDDWRSAWGVNLPFYYAQIAPFIYEKNVSSQSLRDAQTKILETVENTGMAVLLDIGEEYDIHPENKKDVGERLSLHALKNEYNFNLIANGPLYKSHVRKGSRIEVSFDHVANGLVSDGILKGFEVAGNDGVFFPAKAVITNNKIIVSSNKVMSPVHVRYGWRNWFVGTLFNSEGLPASSFSSM